MVFVEKVSSTPNGLVLTKIVGSNSQFAKFHQKILDIRVNSVHSWSIQESWWCCIELDGLSSFRPQELTNIVWAYATANEQHLELFKKVVDVIVEFDDLRNSNRRPL